MANENYILLPNDPLLSFSGKDIHEILTYVKQNHIKIDNGIKMFIAASADHTSILPKDGWENNQYVFIVDNTPADLDYRNGNGINIIISPTEDYGVTSDEDGNIITAEETSSELYNESSIRCIQYELDEDSKKLKLTFKCDDLLEYNIKIQILIFYNSVNIYNIPAGGGE